jgi:hypothetical protein
LTAFALVLALLISSGAVVAETSLITRCLLQAKVAGYEDKPTAYIEGPCHWTPLPDDGGFKISNVVFFAEVRISGDGHAEGWWNEDPWDKQPKAKLGALHRDGACWANEDARVCAWR